MSKGRKNQVGEQKSGIESPGKKFQRSKNFKIERSIHTLDPPIPQIERPKKFNPKNSNPTEYLIIQPYPFSVNKFIFVADLAMRIHEIFTSHKGSDRVSPFNVLRGFSGEVTAAVSTPLAQGLGNGCFFLSILDI